MRLSRRELLFGAAALPLLGSESRGSGPGGSQLPRPSVLLILVDDLAAWMLGCYGNREIRTPNIDILSRSGAHFVRGFAATPVPAPSRATLLTGRTVRQLGMLADGPATLANEVLLSDVLAGAGYECGYCGAWEFGSGPQHGIKFWDQSPDAAAVSAKALEFLDARKPGQPFFLTASYQLPAAPAPKYRDLYRGASFDGTGWQPLARNAAGNKAVFDDIVGAIRGVAASVTALDVEIERLIKKLDERGLRDETLIVFTATCGSLVGRHGLWGDGRASEPPNMYEEVVGVPVIWQWQGHIPPESVRPEVVGSYEVFPTICDLTQTTPPASANLSGRSYRPAVVNDPFPKKRPWVGMCFGQFGRMRMARDRTYKLVLREGGPNELYDVNRDSGEKVNQYASPGYSAVRDVLTKALDDWSAKF